MFTTFSIFMIIIAVIPPILYFITQIPLSNIFRSWIAPKKIGNIVVDHSDPNEPYYFFLEIQDSRMLEEAIQKESTVTLQVVRKNYISYDDTKTHN